MKTFWIRTASAVVYAVLFLGSLLSGFFIKNPVYGLLIFSTFLGIVMLGCTYEFFRMVKTQGSKACEPLAVAYCLITFAVVIVPPVLSSILNGFVVMLSAFVLFPCAFALAAIV